MRRSKLNRGQCRVGAILGELERHENSRRVIIFDPNPIFVDRCCFYLVCENEDGRNCLMSTMKRKAEKRQSRYGGMR